jgi:AraC-like DNA-binding protein
MDQKSPPRRSSANSTLGGSRFLTPLAGNWGAQLGALMSWELCLDLFGELLADKFARRRADPTPEVAHAWRRLRSTHGSGRISELVDGPGLSHRALLSRFRRQVGVALKTAARILRATALLAAGMRSVAEVAAESFRYTIRPTC